MQNLDCYGAPLKNTSHQLNVPYSNPCLMTAYTYDTVRALAEINDPGFADAYPWISSDGLRLYYTTGYFTNHLMFTHRPNTNSYFVTPTPVPISITSAVSCWLSSDELDMYVSDGNALYYSHRDGISQPFDTSIIIALSGIAMQFFSGVSLNAEQEELFLYSQVDDGILEFSRTSSTSFAYAGTLLAPTGYSLEVGQLSKDDLTLFFGATYNSGVSLLYQMTRNTPTGSFDTSTFQQIQGINNTYNFNGQPSMSDSLNWVVFVRSGGMWEEDDLFIAHKGTITSAFSPEEIKIYSFAYPNPSSDYLDITFKTSSGSPLTLSIFSSLGTLIYQQVITPSSEKLRIDTQGMSDGLYYYRLSQANNNNSVFGTGKFVVSH